MNTNVSFARSKSFDYSNKIKVLSPAPIRVKSAILLDELCGFSSNSKRPEYIEFGDREERYFIRKFQSLGSLEMEREL